MNAFRSRAAMAPVAVVGRVQEFSVVNASSDFHLEWVGEANGVRVKSVFAIWLRENCQGGVLRLAA